MTDRDMREMSDEELVAIVADGAKYEFSKAERLQKSIDDLNLKLVTIGERLLIQTEAILDIRDQGSDPVLIEIRDHLSTLIVQTERNAIEAERRDSDLMMKWRASNDY